LSSSLPADTAHISLGIRLKPLIAFVWPSNVYCEAPVSKFQIRSVLSELPEITSRPSAVTLTLLTELE
jgi:hypothetical protein